ncbi:MAG: hypothetical protein JXA20_08020 [Spirochaetes bacterium]|nr:hypothetical protein [Spirochaetota bacterium]
MRLHTEQERDRCTAARRLSAAAALAVSLLALSCTVGTRQETSALGWIDDSTYVVEAAGLAAGPASNREAARKSARESAVAAARKIARERFVGERIGAGFDSGQRYVAEVLGPLIDRGEVIRETWEGDGACQVRYRVSSPGLKDRLLRMSPRGGEAP